MTTEQLSASVSEFSVEVNGGTIPVIRFGNGKRTLAIVAGMSLSGLKGQGQGVAAAYADFSDEYTVYLFDRRDQLPYGFTVSDMADDIYKTLIHLGVTQADIYGVSQGGMIGFCLAIDHPEFVRRLAVCSSTARADDAVKATMAKWIELGQQRDVVAINRCFFDMVYSQEYLNGFKDILPELEKQGTEADCVRFEILAQACAGFDVDDRLDRISCPTLVIADHDDKVLRCKGLAVRAIDLRWEVELLSGYGHAVYDEAAQVKQRLLGFLTK